MKSKLSVLSWLVRLALAGIFITASVYKIVSPGDFSHQIFNYKILPGEVINPLALSLPWLQLLCGLAILFGKFEEGAILLMSLMLLVFQAAVGSALVRGLNISCGCFKSGGSPATWLTFGRDFLMLAVAIFYGWWIFKGRHRAA